MKKMECLKRILSLVLTLSIMLSCVPVQVFALETEPQSVPETTAPTETTAPAETDPTETTAPADTQPPETTIPADTQPPATTEPAPTEMTEVPEPSVPETTVAAEPAVIHEHEYKAAVTAPTCTAQGYTTYTCDCSDSYVSDYVDATGHSYENGACTVCGEKTDNPYEGKTIACIGDSITAAYGVTKDETDYVTLLAQQLDMDYIRLGDSGTTLCTDGSRTCNIRRLTEDQLQGADVVTIAMGINDFCNAAKGYYALGEITSTDSSTIYGAARLWCERIAELRKTDSLQDTQFYFVTPVICSWNNSVTASRDWDQSKTNIHGYTLRDLCNAIIEVAALYDVPVIDLNLLSGMYYVDAQDNNTAVFGGDGVHPGEKGHEMMAQALAKALLQKDQQDDHAHTFGSWITTTYPNCKLGEQQRVCAVCTATEKSLLAATHKYESAVTDPTCTEKGYTTYTCDCGDSYVGDYVNAKGHSYEDGVCTGCGEKSWEDTDTFLLTLTSENYLTISNPDTEKLSCGPGLVAYGDGKFAVAYLADDTNTVETEASTTIVCRLGLFDLRNPEEGAFFDVATAGQTIGDVTIGDKAPYEPNLLRLSDNELLVLFNIRDTSGNYVYYSARFDTVSNTITAYQPLTLDGKNWIPANIAASYNAIAQTPISTSGPTGSMVFTSEIIQHEGYYYGYCGGICGGFSGMLVRSSDGINWTSVVAPEAADDMNGVIECGFQFLGDTVYFCMRDISAGVYHCSYNFTTGEPLVKTAKISGLTTSKPAAFIQDGKLYLIVNKATGDDSTVGRRNTALFYQVDPETCRLSLVRQVFCADGCAYHTVENFGGKNYWCFHTDARRINPYSQGRSNLAFREIPALFESENGNEDGVLNLDAYSYMYGNGCITTATNIWQTGEGVPNYHYQIPLADFADFDTVTITANAENKTYLAFFADWMTRAGTISYAEGWTEQMILEPGTVRTVPIPEDARYLYILNNNAAGDSLLPSRVVFSKENVQENLKGKTISILGASISTYEGTSNSVAADTTNSTIRSNVKYYPNTTIPEVGLNDTWWMQVAEDLGLRLLVNNAWSGSAILLERSGTVGAYVDRCVQLHDDTGDNAGEEPDIICIQMGFNDFSYGKDTLGTAADIDYDTLITTDGYGTPSTTMEATAIMLDKITKRYPDAEVYMFNHFKRIGQSAADTTLMEGLNGSIETVCARYGVKVVDLYTTLTDPAHIGDGRLHPNKLGMDVISEAVKTAIIGNTNYQVTTHTAKLALDGVTADYGTDKILVDGTGFAVKLTAPAGDTLSVTVTMGGEDITNAVYANGTVSIEAVNGDVVITAQAVHTPKDYRWEFNGTDLACVSGDNALIKKAGTTTEGVFSTTRYALAAPVVLSHDQPWSVEWKCEGTFQNANGSSGARVFTSDDVNANYNARYIFKSNTNGIVAMGEKTTTGSHNYGIALKDHGIDWTALHTYRLENRIANDGSNMVYLWVDGTEIGPMTHYYVGTTDKKTTSDWLSGKDFVLPYMGTDTHGFTNCSIDYIQVWEGGKLVENAEPLLLRYDDHYDISGKTVEIVEAGENTVVTVDGNYLVATGIGTAKVRIDGQLYEITVEKAKINLVVIMGQSNAGNHFDNALSDVTCPVGTAYWWGNGQGTAAVEPVPYTQPSKGFHTPLLAELYAQSVAAGDPVKNVLIWQEGITSKNGQSITKWASSATNTGGTDATVAMIENCRSYYETHSDKYEIVNAGVYWLQGESDTAMDPAQYTQLFMAMWQRLKAAGMEYLAFLRLRWGVNGNGEDHQDLHHSASLSAQIRMINENPEFYMATDLTENWVGTAETVHTIDISDYITVMEAYGQNPSYTDSYGNTASYAGGKLTTTMKTLYGSNNKCHYGKFGYGLIGADAAFNMYNALHKQDVAIVVTDTSGHADRKQILVNGAEVTMDITDMTDNLSFRAECGSAAGTLKLLVKSAETDITENVVVTSGLLYGSISTADLRQYKDVTVTAVYTTTDGIDHTVTCVLISQLEETQVDYIWDFNEDLNARDEDGNICNSFLSDVLKGSYTLENGYLNAQGLQLDLKQNIRLAGNKNWSIEWKYGALTNGTAGFLLCEEKENTVGNRGIYHTVNGRLMISDYADSNGYRNYTSSAVTVSENDCLRITNRYDAATGKSTLSLWQNGELVIEDFQQKGSINKDHDNTDMTGYPLTGYFDFAYLGNSGNDQWLVNCELDYLKVTFEEEDSEALAGKVISILGDSISTYTGVSNDASVNATLKGGAIYYNAGIQGVYRPDTWWQQTIDVLDMELLVNNSWSGSTVLHTRSGTAGAYVNRCVQLHNDQTGEEPDVIVVFLGTNDFSYYQSALGTANIDYAALITNNGDGTYTYAVPKTTCEAYAVMLHKMVNRYPDAEVYCMNLLPRREPDHDGKDVVPAPTQFNGELAKVISHFGCTVVDLENCGITPVPENFDIYITDQRVHPGPLGMDKMTQALINAMMGQKNATFTVSQELVNVTAGTSGGIVLNGDAYATSLSATEGFDELTVTVTMGGKDITASVYKEGKVTIPAVTGDVVITAAATIDDIPDNYYWETNSSGFANVASEEKKLASNTLTKKAGSITDGVFKNAYFQLEKPVVLRHDLPWVVEWCVSGESWSGMLFSAEANSSAAGNNYLFKTTQNTGFIGFGEPVSGSYQNYGVALEAQGVDTATEHTYRIENRIASDGSNMAYFLVDGKDYGPMNHYYIGGNSNQGKQVNWLNGRDFCFSYIGSSSHTLNNAKLKHLAVWEGGQTGQALKGKVISILGDSISTFAGYIPVADGFNLEHLARYPQDNLVTDVNETWWMQIIDQLDAKLGINDSWRGATVSGAAAVTSGTTGANAAMANLTRIRNLGSNGTPDVILFYGGTNDLAHVSKVGSFDPATAPGQVDLTTASWDNLADGYVHTLLRLKHYYPDAIIVAMLPTYTASYYSDTKLAQANELLAKICEHYSVPYVDLRDSGVTAEYLPDGIHPGAEGMDMITDAVLEVLAACETEAGEHTVHPVSHTLTNVKASLGHYKGIDAGAAFRETLSADGELLVTVTMNGQDITETCYSDGVISIDAVSGALAITAKAKFSLEGHWQALPGSYHGKNLWPLLDHDAMYYTVDGWAEHASGKVRSVTVSVTPGEKIVASSFAAAGTNGSSVDGIRVTFFSDDGVLVSMSADAVHKEFAENGYLTVPENATAVCIPMWTPADTWELYIHEAAWEPGAEGLAGKTVSILGHSMSTYAGVSNNTTYNSTIGSNDVYYTEGKLGVYREDTWWQQAIDALGMELLVNNSWSGSCVFQPRKGEASVGYGDRAVNLHNDHTGEEPDIIWVYIGCNDFAYYKDTFGTGDAVDYSSLIQENGDGTFTYAAPQTACEAYAIMLHKVENRYPDADIYCITSTARRDPDYTGDSYPDAGQPTAYMAELHKVAKHFACPVVDLEDCIPKEAEQFDQYIGDKRAHANALGMDKITCEVLSVMLDEKAEICHVTCENDAVKEQAVLLGGSYSAEVALQEGYSLTVTMGGEDVTEKVYQDGKITIDEVTGDIAVYAVINREPMNFGWALKDGELVSVGETENSLRKITGTVTDGLLNDGRFELTTSVMLKHDLPWEVEWKCAENWRGVLLSTAQNAKTEGMTYLSRVNGGQLCFGTWTGTQYDNYGIDISYLDDQSHTYRLRNRPAADGSNMVWLYVDGVEIGPMDQYYIGSNDQNKTADWISGQDFVLHYIGMEGHALRNCRLDYLRIRESGHTHDYASAVTEPTCTEQGYTTHTCTVCGDSYVDSYVETVWHDYDAGKCAMCGCDLLRITLEDIIQYQGGVDAETGTLNTTFTNNWYTDIHIPKGAQQVRVLTFKTGGNWGSAFFNGTTYLSGFYDPDVGGQWVTEAVPETATVFRYGYLYDDIAQNNNWPVFQYLEFAGQEMEDWEGPVDTGRPSTGCHSFSVEVNIAPAQGDPDGYTPGTDYGYIQLPTNYDVHGEPTRLIIVCHGAGASLETYQSDTWKNTNYSFWTDLGYAVMDMYACPPELTGDNGCLHYGNPVVLECYKKGYDYVMEHFNLKKDGIFVIGSSMGGLSSFQIAQSGLFPVIAQVGYCPVIDLFKQAYCNPWTTASYQRSRIASYFGFNGTAPAFTSSKYPSDAEIEYYRQNFDKTIAYSPILRNVVDGDVTSIFGVIPGSATAADAAEAAIYDSLTAVHPCPLMIFHNTDDSTVSYRYSQYFVDMVNRSGQDAILRTFTSGGHNAWANGESVAVQGINGSITLKESQYEAYLFFEKFEKHEEHQSWVDPAVKPTCTESGLTEGEHCAVCGEVLVAQKKVEATGHSYDAVVTEPTCTEQGYTTHTCTVCGDSYVDSYTDPRPLNILMIGNSFSWDAADFWYDMQESMTYDAMKSMLAEPYDIHFAVMYKGSATLAYHATCAMKDTRNYTYTEIGPETNYVWTPSGGQNATNGILEHLEERDWDIIVIQSYQHEADGTEPRSTYTGGDPQFEKPDASLGYLLDYFDEHEPGAQVYYYMPWATTKFYEASGVEAGYKAIAQYSEEHILHMTGTDSGKKLAGIIPVGTGIQNARTTYLDELRYSSGSGSTALLQDPQIGLQYDNQHLSFGIGRYIAGIIVAESLIPQEMRKDSYSQPGIKDSPSVGSMPVEYTQIAQKAAAAAMEQPYAVTVLPGYEKDLADRVCDAIETADYSAEGIADETAQRSYVEAVVAEKLKDMGSTESAVTIHSFELKDGKIAAMEASVTLRIGYTGSTAEISVTDGKAHRFGDWECISVPSAAGPGLERRTCETCGFVDERAVEGSWQKYALADHLQELPEKFCSETNLWSLLEPETVMIDHLGNWVNAGATVYSVTIPITPGEKIYANSFDQTDTRKGIQVSFIGDYGIVKTTFSSGTYEEFHANGGYLIAPEGAIAVNIPVWNVNDADNTIHILGYDHVYESMITVPTCTEKGYTTHTCTGCGDSYVDNEIAAFGHTEVTDQAVEATCTTTGLTEGKRCSVCETILVKQEVIPAKGHTETIDKAVEATCTETGLTEGKHCSACGEVLVKQEVVPAKGHSWDNGEVTKEPTEETDGERVFTCTVCGEIRTEIIPSLNHVHTYDPVVTAPTCTEKGYTTHTCRCGDSYVDSYVEATGHSYGEWMVTTAPTCTEKGTERRACAKCDAYETRDIAATGHVEVIDEAMDATCTETGLTEGKHCSVCGEVLVKQEVVAAKGHNWDNGEVTKEPTEETDGERVFTCTACGEIRTEIIPSLNHVHTYEPMVTAPTCTEKGYTTHTCRCGDSYTDSYVAAKGHTEVTDKAVTATCTETGLTEGKHCSVCGEVLVKQEVVPAKGHTEVIDKAVEATCTETGLTEGKHCSVCGEVLVKQEVVAAKGHTEVTDKAIAATCTETGLTEGKHCSVCDTVLVKQNVIPAKGHVWNGSVCSSCGQMQGYRIDLDPAALGAEDTVWIDGVEYPAAQDGRGWFTMLDHTNATNLVIYTYNDPYAQDVHTQYPTGMKVWMLHFENGAYTAQYIPGFDNLLQYSGSSIRIVGVKGIRMITSIEKSKRDALTGAGLDGYTLVEYGTAVAWTSDLAGGEGLLLGKPYTKSNFAYKRGVADPIFNDTGDLLQYTNVLVGFSDDQCIPDLAMRPYIILEDADGRQITIYGGTVCRSIGYIAWQNRTVFPVGSAAYEYVWGIIHHVYGDRFDADYKG